MNIYKYLLISAIILVLILGFFLYPPKIQADISNGLVGWWKFDEGSGTTAQDSSGNGNNGTLTNGPTWTTGKISNALQFNGTNQNVTVSDSSSLGGMPGLTVSAWVRFNQLPSVAGNSATILSKRNSATPWFSYNLRVDSANNRVTWEVNTSTGGWQGAQGATVLQVNTWYHILGIYDGSNIHIYLNGVLNDAWTPGGLTGTVFDSNSTLNINHSSYLNGLLDDVRIYNRALSASEITELYNYAGGGTPTPFCGDSSCNGTETCSTCPTDCGICTDTTPPSVPIGLTASAISSSQINLSWTASTDPSPSSGLAGYRIYRCQGTGCTPSVQIATSPTNSYSDTGLSPSTTYIYTVAAYDAAGNVSGQSTSASATTQAGGDTTPPIRSAGSPSGTLTAGTTQTTLSLTTNENATCRYSTTAGTVYSSMTLQFNSGQANTFHSTTVSGLQNGQTYNYYIRCIDTLSNVNTDDYAVSFSVASAGGGTTYTCGTDGVNNSCTPAGMTALIASASSGDTINIAIGTHSWTNMVTITKPLTISGGGTYAVDANHNDTGTWPVQLSTGSSGNGVFGLNSPTSGNLRITGIHFYGDTRPGAYDYASGMILGFIAEASDNRATYRIDHNKFHNLGTVGGYQASIYLKSAYVFGLIDHNYFLDDNIERKTIMVQRNLASESPDPQSCGNYAWSQSYTWGSADFVFIEDNSFIGPNRASTFAPMSIDSYCGGRWVARYNYFKNGFLEIHVHSGGSYTRTAQAAEVYNNTGIWEYASSRYQCFFYLRGGNVLYHHNDIAGFQEWLKLSLTGGSRGSFGTIDGTKAWDGNLGAPYPAGYPALDQIGRGKAASANYPNGLQPQESKPTRIWHNSGYYSTDKVVNISPDYVGINRDYYYSDDDSAAEPGYTPYPYPHPLTLTGTPPDTTPPAAPIGVAVN